MSTYSLSGTGIQALSAGVTALHVTITTLPAGLTHGRANPSNHFDIALLRFGDGTGFWTPIAINGGPDWLGVPRGTTQIGYSVLNGAVISVVEVIGGFSPFDFSPLAPLASVSGFSWTNQGSASATLANGILYLTTPGAAAGGVRVFTKAAPAKPYTITVGFQWYGVSGTTGASLEPACGLTFRESSTGKLHYCSLSYLPASTSGIYGAVQSRKFTNPTTFSADYVNHPSNFEQGPSLRWMRMSDDNSNRKFDISADGFNWFNFHTVTRLDFLTGGANEVGFVMRSENDAGSQVAMSILSYAES